MAKSTAEAEIRACVDSFVTDLRGLLHKATVESVLETVTESLSSTARPGPGRPKKAAPKASKARRTKRGRRSTSAVGEVGTAALSHVKANAGCSVSQIGAALGMATKELRLPLQKLLAEGKVRTTGQKRGTRYHAGGRPAAKKAAVKKGKAKKKAKKKATRKKATRKKKA